MSGEDQKTFFQRRSIGDAGNYRRSRRCECCKSCFDGISIVSCRQISIINSTTVKYTNEFWTQTSLWAVSSNITWHHKVIRCLAFIYIYLLCNFIVSDAIRKCHLWNNGQQEWDEVWMLIADRANNISFECHQLIFFYSNATKPWCQVTIFCVDAITLVLYLTGGTSIYKVFKGGKSYICIWCCSPHQNPKISINTYQGIILYWLPFQI